MLPVWLVDLGYIFIGALYPLISRGNRSQGIFRDERDFKRFLACRARSIAGYTVKEIADHFRRSSVTVSEAITKVEDLLRKDIAIAKELELLTENLIKGRRRKYRITEA